MAKTNGKNAFQNTLVSCAVMGYSMLPHPGQAQRYTSGEPGKVQLQATAGASTIVGHWKEKPFSIGAGAVYSKPLRTAGNYLEVSAMATHYTGPVQNVRPDDWENAPSPDQPENRNDIRVGVDANMSFTSPGRYDTEIPGFSLVAGVGGGVADLKNKNESFARFSTSIHGALQYGTRRWNLFAGASSMFSRNGDAGNSSIRIGVGFTGRLF